MILKENFYNTLKSLIKKNNPIIDTPLSSLAAKILTEKEDVEKIQPYLDKLKDSLNTKYINNIALTGGYGSGKSTILKTFQYWYDKDFNFFELFI